LPGGSCSSFTSHHQARGRSPLRRSARLPSTEPGDRIYAIGDVHGCHDLLERLLDRIGEHSERLSPDKTVYLVFLGDMVDRGTESARVLDIVHGLASRSEHVVTLLGNHEDMMLQALAGEPDALRDWMRIGGDDTVRSFGLEPFRHGDAAAYLRQLRGTIPRAWVDWLRRCPLTVQSGEYFFCHAGVRPGVPLRRQKRTDLLWIREEFLDNDSDHGATIVHGHTVEREVTIRHNRIGVDIGAYRRGTLASIYLEDDKREVLLADSNG
jgi:serine/threonine protein phosphatase 1